MVDPSKGNTPGTLQPESVSTKQRRIAELAHTHPQRVFIALNHYLDYDWLYQAYLRTRKDGAPGIDGVTAADYESPPPGEPRKPLGTAPVGLLPGSGGPAGVRAERRRNAAAAGHPDLRGQSGTAGPRDAAGTDL